MVRRTKQDSEQTRLAIIAAARAEFLERGVTRTTMEQIAAAAGVTRGAVYWHFSNKIELFYAMRDQVTLPLIDRTDFELLGQKQTDPLKRVEHFLVGLTNALVGCEIVQQTFEIMTFKCEYVDEFHRDLLGSCRVHEEILDKLKRVYREAGRAHLLRSGLSPELAAGATMIFVSGLIKLWLMDANGKMVRKHVAKLIAAHVASHRAEVP